jgi:hypothetical protein
METTNKCLEKSFNRISKIINDNLKNLALFIHYLPSTYRLIAFSTKTDIINLVA